MKKRTRITGFLILAVLVLMGGVLAYLQTASGKRMLVRLIERQGVVDGIETLHLGTISGWIPMDVQIDFIELRDEGGVWLRADQMEASLSLKALLHSRLHLRKISAERIALLRRPIPVRPRKAASSLKLPENLMAVQLDQLNIDEFALDASLFGWPLKYRLSEGRFSSEASGAFHAMGRIEGDARGSFEAQWKGPDASPAGVQVDADLMEMTQPDLGLDHVAGRARFDIRSKGLDADLAVQVKRDELDGHIKARLTYEDRRLQVRDFELSYADASLAGRLDADFSSNQIPVHLLADLSLSDEPLTGINMDLVFSKDPYQMEISSCRLQLPDQGAVSITGTLSPEQLKLSGTLDEVQLNPFMPSAVSNIYGSVSGTLDIAGTWKDPEMDTALDFHQIRWGVGRDADDPMVDGRLVGRVAEGRLQLESALSHPGLQLSTEGRMPLELSMNPITFRPHLKELKGTLSLEARLKEWNRYTLLSDQRVDGVLSAELLYDRSLSGSVSLKQGHYEHYQWGLVLQDLMMEAQMKDHEWVVTRGDATDGDTGALTLSGGMEEGQLALEIKLAQMALLQLDGIEAMLSGHVGVEGHWTRPFVKGAIEINRADILIDDLPPPLPPLLTDYDADAPRTDASAPSRAALPYDLLLEVDLADQVYANASMIDSIWGGRLTLRSTTNGIAVSGGIEPRRGYVSFIGKKFRFTDGQIDVDGTLPLMPVFNQLTSEYNRGDFTARLILNGRMDRPDYRLESTPAMPQDEVLSHVLFNRDSSSISPYQAIQIASAARQLSGGLNGPGFMYQMRQVAGVDTLEWREGQSGETASSVAAGKYVTPALYVEFNRSFDQEGDMGMMAEYEVTRHLSIETSTGPKMRPGIGVNWRYDY